MTADNSTANNSSAAGGRRLRFLLTKEEKDYIAALKNYSAENPIPEKVTTDESNSTDQNSTT
jgi:hypothetical protein